MSNSIFVVDDERQRQKMTDEFYANYKKDIEFYQERVQHFIDSGCESKAVIKCWLDTGPSCLLARHAAACGAKLVDSIANKCLASICTQISSLTKITEKGVTTGQSYHDSLQ